ncbi:MAG: O-antigen ligase family protein [Chloroflexi bacterium]|nr:O-antigen ligase family protein [Chloroflexota bacterium]
MLTRLAVLCDRLLEAGWLAALIVAPLFFNVYSSRVFEPDKITLVRAVALVMIGAWIVKQLEVGFGARSEDNGRNLQFPRIVERLKQVPRENPLALPTLAVVVVYIISTVFSVVPAVSFWGSYQRLEGTDTTFSYIAIFLIAASTLRSRAQLNRVVNTVLVVSFPIAFYGLIQHFKLDPLPWGGDVTVRVASNMGNSIFLAAYLIMVVPFALARWMETLARVAGPAPLRTRALHFGAAALGLLALAAVWALDLWLGVALALAFLLLAALFAWRVGASSRDSLLVAVYTIILAAELVAILFTQSRGPWLGMAAGLFAFAVLYALVRGARQVVVGAIGLAMIGAAFLILFNIPSSPLEPLKQVPYVGRLGEILDTKSPTAQVRELIWQGAVKLILPHAPLWSPTTGNDPLNAIRPLVGYGPESMYVVYNPFYPPALGDLEQRNASPDRSHNETFDSLVTTGLLGFVAYILLYMSTFYFGLKWLGMINSDKDRNGFIALWLVVGFVSAFIFGLVRGWHFVGVALPAGMILGFLIFLGIDALRRRERENRPEDWRALWMAAVLAAIIGHFIEINFGIAIVSTNLYFWFYAALLVVIGMNRLAEPVAVPAVPAPEPARVSAEPESVRAAKRRKKRREAPRPSGKTAEEPVPLMPVLAWTAIMTLILLTLAFEFVNNLAGVTSALQAVQRSLFYLHDAFSPAVFAIFALTVVVGGVIGFGEEMRAIRFGRNGLLLALALFIVLAFTAFVWFVLFMERALTQTGDLTDSFIGILGQYYIFLFLLIAILGVSLSLDLLPRGALFMRSPANTLAVPILLVLALGLIYFTDYTNVSADILYKGGNSYDSAGAWSQSIAVYERALTLQPNQDFYELFLGRAYLEAARASTDPNQQNQMLNKSEQTLLDAQKLNPLNTDHTANLARLHRVWASLTGDPAQKTAQLQKSSDYYAQATRLSPNTAYLYNEWSQTFMQAGQDQKALTALEQSLKLDPKFAQTYVYLGDFYRTQHDTAQAADSYFKALELDPSSLSDPDGTPTRTVFGVLGQPDLAPRAIAAYDAIKAKFKSSDAPVPNVVRYALSDLYRRTGQMDKARQELQQAFQDAPTDYMVGLTLVNFLSETGQIDAAVSTMRQVMTLLSPTGNSDYARFQDFNSQLQNLQSAIQAVQKAPNDVNAHRTLASLWKARGQPQFALPEYQAIARLAPNDYDANKNLALLNLQESNLDQAQSAIVTAAALAPDNEKPMWQDLQAALNAQKAKQKDEALKQAQAALAIAAEADRPALQAYVSQLQGQ